MDFLAIAMWIFELMVLQLLPLFSAVLLAIGLIKVIQYIPDTVRRYAREQGKRLNKGLK